MAPGLSRTQSSYCEAYALISTKGAIGIKITMGGGGQRKKRPENSTI